MSESDDGRADANVISRRDERHPTRSAQKQRERFLNSKISPIPRSLGSEIHPLRDILSSENLHIRKARHNKRYGGVFIFADGTEQPKKERRKSP
jgi:hypothetical protein